MASKWKYDHGQDVPVTASTALSGKAGGIIMKAATGGKVIVQGTAVSEGYPARFVGGLVTGDSASKLATVRSPGVTRLVASGVISAGYPVEPTVDASTVRVAREKKQFTYHITQKTESVASKGKMSLPLYVYSISTVRNINTISAGAMYNIASAVDTSTANTWCWSTTGKTAIRMTHTTKTGDVLFFTVRAYGSQNKIGHAAETATDGAAIKVKLGW